MKYGFDRKLARRESLLGLLRSSDYWVVSELCNALEVSQRTLMRDLAELKSLGYPIESERGRGGGIRLNGRWGVQRLNLSHHEIIEMLLALAVVENLKSPLFTSRLKSIRQKIASIFPESQRKLIAGIRHRLLVGESASNYVSVSYATPKASAAKVVSECFMERYAMEIQYQDENNAVTNRMVEPHYILLNWPAWYVLCWDHLRDDVRLFRLDRILKSIKSNERFRLKNQKQFLAEYESFFQVL